MLIKRLFGFFLVLSFIFEQGMAMDCGEGNCLKLSKRLDDQSTLEATQMEISSDERLLISILWSDGGRKLPLAGSLWFGASDSSPLSNAKLLCPLMLGSDWTDKSVSGNQLLGDNTSVWSISSDLVGSDFYDSERPGLKRNMAVTLTGRPVGPSEKNTRAFAFVEKIERRNQVVKSVYCVKVN